MSQQRAIRALREGFHRHDKMAQDVPHLQPDGIPEVGQAVRVQANLFVPLPSAGDPEQEIDELALTGEIIEVVDDECVIASVLPTTRLYPSDFCGDWLMELRFEPGWEFPWQLTNLEPQDPEPALPRGFTQDTGLGFRVAWLVPDAEAVLGRLAEEVGGPREALDFLPLAIPAGPRTTTVWAVAASAEPHTATIDLLAGCSDAVIVPAGDTPYTDDVLAMLPGDPAVVRWDRALAPEPFVPLKHALKQLLMELRT